MKRKRNLIISSIIIILLIAFGYGVKKAGENGKLKNKNQKSKIEDNNLIKWEIPADEVFIDSLSEDTNQDGEKETMVITEKPEKKKAYFYILNSGGEKIYQKESSLLPDSIELRKFENDDYNSFFLVFEGQFKEGFFIRWNGREYAIPEEERGE